MRINLSPIRQDDTLTLEREGDVLVLNGQRLDFSGIPDGATLPQDAIDCEWVAGDVERLNGKLHITLTLPHGPEASEAARFPQPIINPEDGVVELPK